MSRIPILKMAILGALPSALKVYYYRSQGAKIGTGVKIGPLSILISKNIEIGNNSRIGALSFIRADKVKIGNRAVIGTMVAVDTGVFELGHDSQIMEQVIVGGMKTPRSKISIGKRVKVFPFSFLNPTEPITIEDDVGIGGANYIFTHGTWQNVLEGYPYSFGSVTIKKGVWLPWRVFVLPGVEIGDHSTIGAGAVINKSIPPRSLAVGMPAKVISSDGAYVKKLTEIEKLDLFLDIIKGFKEWLEYNGNSVNQRDSNSLVSLEIIKDGQSQKLSIVKESDTQLESTKEGDIVIFWKKPSRFENQNIGWFDLTNYICHPGNPWLFNEVRNYLSRYGIRFDIFGEN